MTATIVSVRPIADETAVVRCSRPEDRSGYAADLTQISLLARCGGVPLFNSPNRLLNLDFSGLAGQHKVDVVFARLDINLKPGLLKVTIEIRENRNRCPVTINHIFWQP